MKNQTAPLLPKMRMHFVALAVGLALLGCERNSGQHSKPQPVRIEQAVSPLAIVLVPHAGERRIDADIRKRQAQAQAGTNADIAIERLGWLFVSKARESFDPGYYKLAEQCALYLESRNAGSSEALLLRGHALQSQHRFLEAESLAQQLVAQRGLSFDFGLLGDILIDLGRVAEAADAYQQMLDLKPDPQGYARSAHIRWLIGDLPGAVELMRMAAQGALPRDSESAAWMHTQLARYLWQSQEAEEAAQALQIALELQSDYPPALLWRGRLLFASGRTNDALASLRLAAKGNPLPEYQWALSDALRSAQLIAEAQLIESQLVARGGSSDPRTCSLYLATRGEKLGNAVELARKELEERPDIFTHDALAWALAAASDLNGAQNEMAFALAEGTQDARLYLHAAVIATKAGNLNEARDWLTKLIPLTPLLLPSEKEHLQAAEKRLSESGLSRTSPSTTADSTPFPPAPSSASAREN